MYVEIPTYNIQWRTNSLHIHVGLFISVMYKYCIFKVRYVRALFCSIRVVELKKICTIEIRSDIAYTMCKRKSYEGYNKLLLFE